MAITFPQDHYNHPDLSTEWWYFAGIGLLEGNPANYHVSFFRKYSSHLKREIYFGHFGLNINGAYGIEEKVSDYAGSSKSILQVFIDNWDLHRAEDRYIVVLDKGTSLSHIARKVPVGHRPGYYSISNMDVQGAIRGKVFKGKGWFDHEFFNARGIELLLGRYFWFALQLERNIEIMLYVNSDNPTRSTGTMIFPNGKSQTISPGDYCLHCLSHTNSGWALELPDYGIKVIMEKSSELEINGYRGPDYTEGTIDLVTRKKIGHGFFEIGRGLERKRND